MSLRKSPSLTRALVEANRRNARSSTGPRSAAGKARSSLNSLRHGGRSSAYRSFLNALIQAAPGAILRSPKSFLTPAQADHQPFVEFFCSFWEAEAEMATGLRVRAEGDLGKSWPVHKRRPGRRPTDARSRRTQA